jgi:hypothetical protein
METLLLEQIKQEFSIQQRVGGLQSARVKEYCTAMKNGDTFPPVVVFHDEKKDEYWLSDGFHRCAATKDAGLTEISADVQSGTKRDAILYAVGANTGHGIRRTNHDKRKAVWTLLNDTQWKKWSDHEIAKKTHTTQPFVSKLRREVDEGTMRVGSDGRVINTEKIGKSRAVGLRRVWDKANEEERSRWILEHREEIEKLLGQMDK